MKEEESLSVIDWRWVGELSSPTIQHDKGQQAAGSCGCLAMWEMVIIVMLARTLSFRGI